MGCNDAMPERCRLIIKHFYESFDVWFINAGKYVIKDQDGKFRVLHPCESEKNAES